MVEKTNIGELSSDHQMMIEAMKSQLLIVLVNRLGGEVEIPVREIDGTGDYNLAMRLDAETRTFVFSSQGKIR